MLKNLLALLTVIALGCSSSEPSDLIRQKTDKIIGGKQASHNEYPSIVALGSDVGSSYCSGTLLRQNLVVTAAHCVTGKEIDKIRVIHGFAIVEQAKSTERYRASDIIVHPKYDVSNPINDIAIIVLNENIDTNSCIPILHPNDYDISIADGDVVTIAGYGINNLETGGSGMLFSTNMTVLGRNEYELVLDGSNTESDSCYGDSGGPIYVEHDGEMKVTGVASRTFSPACQAGAVYSLPGRHLEWLQESYDNIIGERDGIIQQTDLTAENCNAIKPPKTVTDKGSKCSIGHGKSGEWLLFISALGLLYMRRNRKMRYENKNSV